jgi:hypothetical protein
MSEKFKSSQKSHLLKYLLPQTRPSSKKMKSFMMNALKVPFFLFLDMKIITFCNELTRELNSIKLTFTKQDIQTKIQRKKFIIDSFKNAIRNAEKIGDK